jgi:hypothetical protein
MNRRYFLAITLASSIMPPLPPTFVQRRRAKKLESPKGAEQSASYKVIIKGKTHPVVRTFAVPGVVVLGISESGGVFTITFNGGTPPFQLQCKTDLKGTWVNQGTPTMAGSVVVPPIGPQGFFRVQQNVEMNLSVTRQNNVNVLAWDAPTF